MPSFIDSAISGTLTIISAKKASGFKAKNLRSQKTDHRTVCAPAKSDVIHDDSYPGVSLSTLDNLKGHVGTGGHFAEPAALQAEPW